METQNTQNADDLAMLRGKNHLGPALNSFAVVCRWVDAGKT